jgi:hypothetical protein
MTAARKAAQGISCWAAVFTFVVVPLRLDAQRIDDAVLGASRATSPALRRNASDVNASDTVSDARGTTSVGDIRDTLFSLDAEPLRPPARRCEGIGLVVTGAVLTALAVGTFFSSVGLGRRTRDVVIPVVIISVAAIGIAAVACNR